MNSRFIQEDSSGFSASMNSDEKSVFVARGGTC